MPYTAKYVTAFPQKKKKRKKEHLKISNICHSRQRHPGMTAPFLFIFCYNTSMAYVYIMSNLSHSVLYIGVTNDIIRRVWEHKEKLNEGFTKDYQVTQLVYVEPFPTITQAITREKQLKKWNRTWKVRLIRKSNPMWKDLYDEICL